MPQGEGDADVGQRCEDDGDIAVGQADVVGENVAQLGVEFPQFARGEMGDVVDPDQLMVHGALPWVAPDHSGSCRESSGHGADGLHP